MKAHSSTQKKVYFVSDIHLGYPNHAVSLTRERKLIEWIDFARQDASEFYFLGDIFDFWWEWKKVVPAGFVRFMGKIAEITDSGIPVYFFIGNHDVWMKKYLEQEIGVKIIFKPLKKNFLGKDFYLAHGDGLGPGDYMYKLLKVLFHNKILQWFFSRLHPNFSIGLAHLWSRSSRGSDHEYKEFGDDKEWLIIHSRNVLENAHFDYFIYGHRHIPAHVQLSEKSTFINTGDWLDNFTYGVFDGTKFDLIRFKTVDNQEIIKKRKAF